MATSYPLPAFLAGRIKQDQYIRWLRRKAKAHLDRDRERGNVTATGESYRKAIHEAVRASMGVDAYTGEALDWERISQYDNEKAKKGGRTYKQDFALLPTVDHVGDGKCGGDFKICSWRTNDAKSDLDLDEFVSLCRRVIDHCESKKSHTKTTSAEFRSGSTRTTQIGYVNRNQQRCDGHRGVSGNDSGQVAYKMTCLVKTCGHVYGANGTDVFQRKCPRCQGGAPGLDY